MLGTVYRMLVLNLGVPPTEFTWTRKDEKGNPVETAQYTPMSFLEKYGDKNLLDNYVMLMNDPSREYYKCYEIDLTATATTDVTGPTSICLLTKSRRWPSHH